jgi:hypothetical protein
MGGNPLTPFRQYRRTNHSLPITQPTISRANPCVLKNLIPLFFEPFPQQPRQPPIMHAPTAEHNLPDSSCVARIPRSRNKTFRNPRVKPSRSP